MAGLVRLVGFVIAFVIVVGIALVLLDANEDSGIVKAWLDVCRFFTEPFDEIFERDDVKERIGINWGIAAVIYAVVAAIIARLLARARMPGRLRRRRRH